MKILLIEPYYGGSHRAWVDGYRKFSRHQVVLLTLPARAWTWRMLGGAVTLARLFNESDLSPDLILASDMFDLSTFRSLTRRRTYNIPVALYFHESQLTYPQNSRQDHGWRFAFINYISAMSADAVYFNSAYHLEAFFANLPRMLRHYMDYNELETVELLRERSAVLLLGLDLGRFEQYRVRKSAQDQPPLIVWNHRWEEDKNPQLFLRALYALAERGVAFRVALMGENFRQYPHEFETARSRLGERVIQYGYVADFSQYATLLWQADYAVSTAFQDFFGAAMAEAIYCNCIPLMPYRLNYPYLLPEHTREACLFRGNELLPLLMKHLAGTIQTNRADLQAHVVQYDWKFIAPQYDDALEQLLARR